MADRRCTIAPRKRRAALIGSLALMGACALGITSASADLSSIGPVAPEHGFPRTFTDRQGRTLELCLDDAQMCLTTAPDATRPPSVPDNFPDEAFWFSADSSITLPGGKPAKLTLALEAAFGGDGQIKDGNQNAFGRIRVRADGLTPGGTYTFTHPYGTTTGVADGGGRVFETTDIGCFDSCPERAYSPLLNTNVGPFLRWDSGAPAGYLGDPTVEHKITGSPFGQNYFRIQGPGGLDLRNDLFTVSGKLAGPPPPPAAFAKLDRSAIDFGSRQVNESTGRELVTIKNVGDANMTFPGGVTLAGADAGQFVLSDNTCTAPVAPAASCSVKVAMRATTVGTHNADLRFGDNAGGSPHLVGLTGVGDPAPAPPAAEPSAVANLSPLSVAFGNRDVGSTGASQSVTLTNTGKASITIAGVGLAGANPGSYAIASNTCTTVAVNDSCDVAVTFSPGSAGSKPATLHFDHDGLGATDVALSGTGVDAPAGPPPAPRASLTPLALSYGSAQVGSTSLVKLATMTNSGDAPMSVSAALTGADGADFVITSNGCAATLPPSGSCQVGVAFKPQTAGADKVALLRFTDNSGGVAGSTQDVTLTGSAVAPPPAVAGIDASPNPAVLADSNVGLLLGLGATATFQTITVTSNGTAPLTISGAGIAAASTSSAPGDYSISSNSCSGSTRAPGATCAITVRFQASARSTRNATLTITSNAPTSPTRVALTGKGV